ncbi:MAG TPA: amino acid permease, partial [Blastocatellia bacterium]|nr:amino acid permease [Blastocatellia bacterium]
VGSLGLTAISLNGVIGSGIFVLPATVAALMGPSSPVAYLLAAFATALIVLCFAEAGSRFDRTGGPYLYTREAFGAFIGFEVGWMFLLTRLAASAAISNAFAAYLGYLVPAFSSGTGRVFAIAALTAVLAWLNLIGIRYGSWTVNLLTVAKLIPLLLFIVAGLAAADHTAYTFGLSDTSGLKQASLALIFAFGGFENASVPGEEIKNPARSIPIALLTSISVTTVVYVLVQMVALGTLPSLEDSKAPLAVASELFLGSAGAIVITIGAVLSTSGSISALMLVGPRILYAFSEGKQLPSALSRIHPRYRTPHIAVLVFALVSCAVAIYGSFAELVAVSAIARLFFSAMTCLAVPVLRRKKRSDEGRFKIPGGILIPVLAAAISFWLLSGSSARQAIAGALALGVGAVLYALFGRGNKAKSEGGPDAGSPGYKPPVP